MISQDKQKRRKYEARQKAILDYKQGMKETHEEGIAIGEERGERKKAIAIAKKMFAHGDSVADIAFLTDLTVEEIESLANGSDLPSQS